MYRHQSDELFLGSASDPTLVQPRSATTDSSGGNATTTDDEDDEDQGVQVEVVERPSGYESKVVPAAKGKGGGSSGVRSRKGGRR